LQGFAIGSAALVSLALFGAFVSRAGIADVNVLNPKVFVGLLVGAMLPYWFSAMTMKSVGSAALKMVEEVRRQFITIPGLMEGRAAPDYARCVRISTDASLKEMMPPGALVLLAPLVAGTFFGVSTLAGLLAGALVSGVQVYMATNWRAVVLLRDVYLIHVALCRLPYLLPTVVEHGTMPRNI
jgi:inorganic pyrophosphatase